VNLRQVKRPTRLEAKLRAVRQLRSRYRLAGCCVYCGKKREQWKWRCNACQAKEADRFRKKYPNRQCFHTIKRKSPKKMPRDFAKKIEGWSRVGWDPIERLRREKKR